MVAAAAKLLQSCLTLCSPTDGSPPGPSVPGILQARTLEWVLARALILFPIDNKSFILYGFRVLNTVQMILQYKQCSALTVSFIYLGCLKSRCAVHKKTK